MAKPVLLLPSKREKPSKGWACLTCGAWFHEDQVGPFTRHATACAERNVHIERDLSLQNRLGIFGGGRIGLDNEYESWVKRNARAIIEKRVRM